MYLLYHIEGQKNRCRCLKIHLHPIAKRTGYRQNESPIIKTKAKQSFCYAPTVKTGCVFSIRFSWIFLPLDWQRKKHACTGTYLPTQEHTGKRNKRNTSGSRSKSLKYAISFPKCAIASGNLMCYN